MSLFAHPEYRWRETYCVLFREEDRPTAMDVEAACLRLGSRYELLEIHGDDDGKLDSLTLVSSADFAAMDISFVSGDEEIEEHLEELMTELKNTRLNEEEKEKARLLKTCNARFDIYHFEKLVDFFDIDDDDEYMDPAALLVVLEWFGELCKGVGIDMQSNTIM